MPVDLFPDINIPQVVVRDVLQRHAAGADRDRHHGPLRAVLHARRGHRSHGVAVAAGRQHHPACSSSRARTPTPTSPRSRTSRWPICGGCRRGRCRRSSRSSTRRACRSRSSRSKGEGLTETQLRDIGPVHDPQSAGGRAGRVGAAALRREVPADHGLRRSGQAAGVSAEPDGRRARGQQREPDSALRRREDRAVRLHDLHQQPVPQRPRHQPHSAQDGGERVDGARERHRARGGRATRSRTTSCRWTASGRRFCR